MSDEFDPTGISLSTPGAKGDAGKCPSAQLLRDFSNALDGFLAVAHFGSVKYSLSGWLSVTDAEKRYEDALVRHLLSIWRGEDVDKDSQLPHAYHIVWNSMALAEIFARKHGFDGLSNDGETS
jgi:hypothetical protein